MGTYSHLPPVYEYMSLGGDKDMKMRNQLRICGPFSCYTGYSKMVRAVLRTALLAGFEVQAIESDFQVLGTQYTDGRVSFTKVPPARKIDLPEVQDSEWLSAQDVIVADDAPTLLIQLPHNLYIWQQYAAGPVIGWTMTESDNLCPVWQHGTRCVDLLLAPSNFCLDTYKKVVPDVESALMPIPVDDRLWLPDEYLDRPNGAPPFLFLFVFTTSERKNWRMMIQAFAEEFCDEATGVGLVVKPNGGDIGPLVGSCQQMGAWIAVDTEARTDWTMAALYRACNVVVQPSSEGFGLTFVEGAMVGKPSVALSLGGAADVVTEDTGYIVPNCTMKPLIGHMPNTYPRTHNFASCDIDDLRATLRRAYEQERKGVSKGDFAKVRADELFTPKALAPLLRQRIEEGVAAYEKHKAILKPKTPPRWACAFGAWGDVFACCGKIRKVMDEWHIDSIGVIFYGSDEKIAEWLKLQPWVREVLCIVEKDKKVMTRNFGRACQCKPIHSIDWLKDIVQLNYSHALRVDEVAFTQLRLNEREMPTYWKGAELSVDAHDWAREKAKEIGKPFYLLNPLSIASNKMRDHWRYWSEAITWLLERTDETYALVSEKQMEWPENSRLINLSGQSRSMQDVLALAELSIGAISTSNNLGIYAPIVGISCVIVCARTLGRETFYHRWMEHKDIQIVEFDEAMPQFLSALGKLFLGGKHNACNVERESIGGRGTEGVVGCVATGGTRGTREREGVAGG